MNTTTPSRPHRYILAWLALPILAVLWFLTVAIGVYGWHWQGNTVQSVLRYTPLPMGFVQWRPLSYRSYLQQRLGAEISASVQKTVTPPSIPDDVATKMVRAQVTEQLAARLGVKVSDQDVAQAYQAQLLQTGNAQQITAMIHTLYGWTPEQFQQFVIRPAVVRDKVQEKLSFDPGYSAAAEKQATAVQKIVATSSDSFSDLAKKYSDDAYGATGGDLGFISPGDLTKEIDDVAFSLEPNTVSQVIHTKYGFHIIKPIERKTVDGVDQVHLLQITILAPQVDDAISSELQKKQVLLFIPGLTWSSSAHRAVRQ